MSLEQQTDNRKDKRLLVLLAFGTLIFLSHIPFLLPDRQREQQAWGWLEEGGGGAGLLRVVLSGNDRKEGPFPGGSMGKGQYPGISPRLAFLLARPFPVNRASLDELTLLEGIGPKLAASIIDYRQRRGRINDARELLAVPGIGERLAERIAPQLTFE